MYIFFFFCILQIRLQRTSRYVSPCAGACPRQILKRRTTNHRLYPFSIITDTVKCLPKMLHWFPFLITSHVPCLPLTLSEILIFAEQWVKNNISFQFPTCQFQPFSCTDHAWFFFYGLPICPSTHFVNYVDSRIYIKYKLIPQILLWYSSFPSDWSLWVAKLAESGPMGEKGKATDWRPRLKKKEFWMSEKG